MCMDIQCQDPCPYVALGQHSSGRNGGLHEENGRDGHFGLVPMFSCSKRSSDSVHDKSETSNRNCRGEGNGACNR